LLEHTPVFTVGRGGGIENLLVTADKLHTMGIEFYETQRGGNITFHGPGQLVGYPIMHLGSYSRDIRRYLYSLEEVIIRTLSKFNTAGYRVGGYTGVWVEGKKIASIGVAVKRWVTMHGFALNVQPDLAYLELINPCGLKSDNYTSLHALSGEHPDMKEVKRGVISAWSEVFDLSPAEITVEQLNVINEGDYIDLLG
jgi:lipoate-protein ligase B